MTDEYKGKPPKDYDFNRIAMLLHVIESAKGWPKLQPIYMTAMAELELMCEPEPVVVEEPVVVKDTASQVVDEKPREPVKSAPVITASPPSAPTPPERFVVKTDPLDPRPEVIDRKV